MLWIGDIIYNTPSLTLRQSIPRYYTNVVRLYAGRWLIAGNEAGVVDVFDLSPNPSPLIDTVNLRLLTGHTGPEDIEIRALAVRKHSNGKVYIIAGSSWNRDPGTPSLFVLRLNLP